MVLSQFVVDIADRKNIGYLKDVADIANQQKSYEQTNHSLSKIRLELLSTGLLLSQLKSLCY